MQISVDLANSPRTPSSIRQLRLLSRTPLVVFCHHDPSTPFLLLVFKPFWCSNYRILRSSVSAERSSCDRSDAGHVECHLNRTWRCCRGCLTTAEHTTMAARTSSAS